MTRFARAKGSKASNERLPEDATSWQEMKQGMIKNSNKKIEVLEDESRLFTASTSNNKEKTTDSKKTPVKWSEFPILNQTNHDSTNIKEKKSKAESKKKPKTENLNKTPSKQTVEKKDKKRKRSISNMEEPEEYSSQLISKKKNEKQILNTKGKKHNRQFSNVQIEDIANKASFRKNKSMGEYKRRKPNSQVNKMILTNGNEVEISYYDGFPIKKEDAERLKQLKKKMISKGLPRSEIANALKLERRKAEKALAREKKKVCFNCRNSGHTLSECPSLRSGSNAQLTETGICFKCGSTEHTHFECKVTRGDNFKFAHCFICRDQGHIARQCPDNNKGLYPKGGSCRVCGDVTHLKKDCPKYQSQQEEKKIVADTIDDHNIESLDKATIQVNTKSKNAQRIVKF